MIRLYSSLFPRLDSQGYGRDVFCHTRLSKDLDELESPQKLDAQKSMMKYSSPLWMDNIYKMNVEILATEGRFKDIVFKFNIWINKDYPFKPPQISCTNKTFHPNIHAETGEVSLTMLKSSEWIPSLSLNFIIFALQLILIEPDLTFLPDCLDNVRCADLLKNSPEEFMSILEYTTERNEHIFYVPTEKKLEQSAYEFRQKHLSQNAMECESVGDKMTVLPTKEHDMIILEEFQEDPNTFLNPLKRARDDEIFDNTLFLKQLKLK